MTWLLKKKDLIKATQSKVLFESAKEFKHLSTDSRNISKDSLFIALKGKKFDGHDFLLKALEAGATGFVVEDEKKACEVLQSVSNKITLVQVPDTLKALQDISVFWRDYQKIQVLAVTGSNGKTTTTCFASTLMSSLPVSSSPKSYNNSIGVPLSLLTVSQKNSFFVQEIGTNHPGEIGPLTSLCEPVSVAVTMVGDSHLEGFGSRDSVAQEKQQIYLSSPKAVWIFNRDNEETEKMFQTLSSKSSQVLTFSQKNKEVDVYLSFVKQTKERSEIQGSIQGVEGQVHTSFFGEHNLENLLCAICLSLSAGVSPQEIWKKIPECRTPEGRQSWHHFPCKKKSILFDAYNSNPLSMEAFLKSCELADFERNIFVLGDMKELGDSSKKYHEALSSYPILQKSSFIWFLGEYGSCVEKALRDQGYQGQWLQSKTYDKNLLNHLQEALEQGGLLGIKASRSFALENLFYDLTGTKVFS